MNISIVHRDRSVSNVIARKAKELGHSVIEFSAMDTNILDRLRKVETELIILQWSLLGMPTKNMVALIRTTFGIRIWVIGGSMDITTAKEVAEAGAERAIPIDEVFEALQALPKE